MNIDEARESIIKAVIERAMQFHLVEEDGYIPDFDTFTYDPEKHYLFWYNRRGSAPMYRDQYVVIDKVSGEVKFLNRRNYAVLD